MNGYGARTMKLIRFLFKAPFAILSAIGLLSIVGQFMTLEENLYQTLEAWRSVTRPVWELLLGWIFHLIGFKLPWWLSDYLTVGVTTTIGFVRSEPNNRSNYHPATWIICVSLWPVLLIAVMYMFWFERNQRRDVGNFEPGQKILFTELLDEFKTIWETLLGSFIWLVIIIGINYALVLAGTPSQPPSIGIWV